MLTRKRSRRNLNVGFADGVTRVSDQMSGGCHDEYDMMKEIAALRIWFI